MTSGWYTRNDGVKNAFLFNCSRESDLMESDRDNIRAGTVVLGGKGWVVAERHVFGIRAQTTCAFVPTRTANWQDFEISIMVHPDLPTGPIRKPALRPYNYAVAALTTERQVAKARELNLPVLLQPDGSQLINVELSTFTGQGKAHRASLVPMHLE